jgi:hypothetical protein
MANEAGGEGKGQDGIGLSDNQAVAEQREYPEWILPHSEFGDPECPGLFFPVVNGEQAEITCNDCGLILKSVPAADVRRTLDEMQLTLAVASEICPHCGSVNLFPGFDRMFAFTCRSCGKVARLADDPNIQRFFGPEEPGLNFHEFPEGEEPEIQTGISPECQQNNCMECKGVGEYEGKTIFCVHDCHKVTSAN